MASSHGIARTNRTRTEEQRRQDLDKIKKYRDLEDQIRIQVKQENYADPALFDLTTKLIRLNPEYYTVWNARRRCLISCLLSKRSGGSWRSKASPSTLASGTTRPSSDECSPSSSDMTPQDPRSQIATKDGRSGTTADEEENGKVADEDAAANSSADPEQEAKDIASDTAVIQSELSFTVPLLLEFPKCYWIWNHRKLLLTLSIDLLPVKIARQIWTAELALDSKMLSKDPRNFHAWGYRRGIVAMLESPELEGTSMTESEFEYTTQKIGENLSNFSAWHNRSQLVVRLLDERGADDEARKTFLETELALAREGLNVGPEDQSLWYYHQFLISHITDWVGRRTMTPALTIEERISYVEKEVEEIRDLLEDYDDVQRIFEALLEYSMSLESMRREWNVDDEMGESKQEMKSWLEKLRELDPMRNGRWDDLEQTLTGSR